MKPSAPLLVPVLCLLLVVVPAGAQSTDSVGDTVYVGRSHSPIAAGVIEFVLPSAGFAYAGDWKRGFLPNVIRLATGIGFEQTYDKNNDTCEIAACNVWAVLFLASTIWSIVGAVNTAGDHNATFRRSAGLSVESAPFGGISFGLRVTH